MIKACSPPFIFEIKVFRKFLSILPDDPPLVEAIFFYAVFIMCNSLCCEVDK